MKPIMITVRVTTNEYNHIASLAEEAGTSLNSYVKLRAVGWTHDEITQRFKGEKTRGRKFKIRDVQTDEAH